MSLFHLHFWRIFSLGIEFFFWQLFSFRCIYTSFLSISFHHFFWKVNCHYCCFFKGNLSCDFLYRCHYILLWYFVFILFEVYRAWSICSLLSFFTKDFEVYLQRFLQLHCPSLYYPFIFILCTPNLVFSIYLFSAH